MKKYLEPDEAVYCFFEDFNNVFESFKSPEDGSIFLIEVLEDNDPRVFTPEIAAARRKEIKAVLERGTFEVIFKREVAPGAHLLLALFVFTIKSTVDGEIKYKARYVICGNRDRLKDMIVHSTQTVQASYTRLLLSLASILGFDIWTADVTQAYLQSRKPLQRDIFIRNPAEDFELKPDECLKLIRPLYGLCEPGDLWFGTLDEHLREDLGMVPMKTDPALYLEVKDGNLIGINANYVDDMLRAGTTDFREHCRKTHSTFEMSEEDELPCDFAGFKISGDRNKGFSIDQNQYLRNL